MNYINKNNYEAFFLDYHEGNLSPHQVADLLLFLEQHPELKEDFENFENITLQNISPVTFENKNELKKDLSSVISSRSDGSWDELMIASVEEVLTKGESILLDQQLSVDAKLQHDFLLYQKTKLAADTSIIFENKESLKRKEKKIIPLFYYVAAAASILLIMGLFFIFNNSSEQKLAEEKVQSSVNEHLSIAENNKEEKAFTNASPLSALVIKTKISKNEISGQSSVISDTKTTTPIVYEEKKQLATFTHKDSLVVMPTNSQQAITNNQQPLTIAQVEKKNEVDSPTEFLSIRELAAATIKEKTLDDHALTIQKKTGRIKKLSGWDLAQIAAKGFNKLTGRNVEVKPTYNDQGDVTAFAIGAGEFQISRGK